QPAMRGRGSEDESFVICPGGRPMSPIEIVPGAPESPVVVHVPHGATEIPSDVRRDLLLDDAELAAELEAMTDAGTELIGRLAAGLPRVRPWLAINRFSRLVVDPERFPD